MLLLGSCHWDPQRKILFQENQPLRLPRRAAECLSILVQARGEVVAKELLQDRLWEGRTVEESNLAQCISTLRKALGPESIETVVGVGYRLQLTPAEALRNPAKSRIPALALALCSLVALFALLYLWRSRSDLGQAKQLYDEGMSLVRSGNFAKGMQAGELFERALALDPNFALAYAGLAESAARFAKGSTNAALPLAEKAVRLDPKCGECQAVLGYVNLTREWNWPAAGQALERALAIDSHPSQWRLWRAQWLATQRRLPEAKALLQSAVADDPAKANIHTMLAAVHYFSGETKAAIAEADRAISLNPSHAAPFQWLYRIHWVSGNFEDAVLARAIETVRWGAGTTDLEKSVRDEMTGLFRKRGLAAICNRWLDEFHEGAPANVARCERAIWLLTLGRRDDALAELEAAVLSRPFNLIYAAADPAFAPLHSEPRFQAVLRKLNLPQPTLVEGDRKQQALRAISSQP